MSGYSERNDRILRPAAYPTTDSPLDVQTARDIANNVNHYADIMGQVRCRWIAQSQTIRTPTGNADQWIATWRLPPFPIALLPDGSSYRLRVRLAGCGESAVLGVSFGITCHRLRWSPSGSPPDDALDGAWVTGEIKSTTPAWLTGASRLSAWDSMIQMRAVDTRDFASTVSTIESVGGSACAVAQVMCRVQVWTKCEDMTARALLYGLIVEEWPG